MPVSLVKDLLILQSEAAYKARLEGGLRVVSYNILDGGEGRSDPLAEIILAQNPDVVTLVEAENPDVLHRIARRLKMDFIHAPAGKHAAALLSRFPIVQAINHALLHSDAPRSLLEVLVRTPDGDITLGVVHLSAHAREVDEDKRLRELQTLLKVFEEHRREGRQHLLVGDFNSNSPHQQIDPARCEPATREEWHLNGGELPRRVVQTLLDAGYIDALQLLHPTEAAEVGTFSTQFPGQRVDYTFTFGISPENIRAAWIEQDRLAKFASDHFPIGVEISMNAVRA